MQLEVVVSDAAEAIEAQRGGASRVELAAEIENGGLTPLAGVVDSVANAVQIPVHVMIRPHDRGFTYGDSDIELILNEASRMRDFHVAGIVFGALDGKGHVAVDLVRDVVRASRLPMTFHRAFDAAPSLSGAYAALAIVDGVERVLTAGGAGTAWEGRTCLRELCCGNTMPTVVGGGRIDERNLVDLLRFTGLREVHVSGGARTDGKIDARKVNRLAQLLVGGAAR